MKHPVRALILIIAAAALVDQLTKAFFYPLAKMAPTAGVVGLQALANPGFMLGSLGEFPVVIRVTLVAALAAFLIALTVAMFSLFQVGTWTTVGSGLLLGGFCGNAIDKIRLGYVMDFVAIRLAERYPVMNLADFIEWIGLAMLLRSLVRFSLAPMRPEMRANLWIMPALQKRIIVRLATVGAAIAFVLGVYSLAFVSTIRPEERTVFCLGFLLLTGALAVVFGVFGLHFSHRIAGPLVALERSLQSWRDGNPQELRLRDGDLLLEVRDLRRYYEDVKPSPKI